MNTSCISESAESLARMGTWRLELTTSKLEWSAGMYVLFEIDPATESSLLQQIVETRYDPEVVAACIRLYESGRIDL